MRQRAIKNAPRTGQPILLFPDGDYYPFIGYWADIGRFSSGQYGWIGHESGIHFDSDLTGWAHLPKGKTG